MPLSPKDARRVDQAVERLRAELETLVTFKGSGVVRLVGQVQQGRLRAYVELPYWEPVVDDETPDIVPAPPLTRDT